MTTPKTTRKTRTPAGTAAIKTKKIVKRVKLPPNPFIHEILNLVEEQKTKAKKIDILREYRDDSLTAILIWNFDESVISLLPEGEVPYGNTREDNSVTGSLSDKINDAVGMMRESGSASLGSQDQGKASIRAEYRKFYNFLKGGNNGLSSLRRETMFINILEGLHPLEAEILILVKDKKLTDKYKITKEIVSAAYPQITWGGRS